jgi:hypothetical protein
VNSQAYGVKLYELFSLRKYFLFSFLILKLPSLFTAGASLLQNLTKKKN